MTEAPSGVKLRTSDGAAVDCEVTRAPELDRQTSKGTVEYWVARPVTGLDPALTYQVEIGRQPPMTGVKVVTGLDSRSLFDWCQPKD